MPEKVEESQTLILLFLVSCEEVKSAKRVQRSEGESSESSELITEEDEAAKT